MKFQALALFNLANEQEFGDFFVRMLQNALDAVSLVLKVSARHSWVMIGVIFIRILIEHEMLDEKCQRCTCNKVDTILMYLANEYN